MGRQLSNNSKQLSNNFPTTLNNYCELLKRVFVSVKMADSC
ncbi:hypothetical protein CCYS_00555 [Corynebacterium cystitidis DSM 20524]|uniref:Uncharacterized protein n=1 Tax=Corynebacterium cystitidis DSM 20524 TaxID=1121357 RepID=A0A1H9VT65_9CORY|nr:hypothetical protein CCYS_00555 [Corynebacterium cystitidis DSM 20524]SES25010.1 hypothetical protein SAMN05661109_02383 [Corynebacterium cystitidis DSM 20524]SNV90020.1 Uncharacterised protein [Corynebacterium cystitidis]